ncbi:hypothetical protein FRB98_003302 [Tulasnella sp. 332]|nr:hypothetical protein FRB98_003302 [Tulasnella sp. 332]
MDSYSPISTWISRLSTRITNVLRDLFLLDTMKYEKDIKKLTDADLGAELRKKTRLMTATASGVVSGAVSAFYTYGLSILSSAASGWMLYVAIKKLVLLKAEWDSRKLGAFRIRKRDIIGPLVVGIATIFVGAKMGMALNGVLLLGAELVIECLDSNPEIMATAVDMWRRITSVVGRVAMCAIHS